MPQRGVSQAIGRTLRRDEGKMQPLVVDFVDENNAYLVEFAKMRLKYYEMKEFEVEGGEFLKEIGQSNLYFY